MDTAIEYLETQGFYCPFRLNSHNHPFCLCNDAWALLLMIWLAISPQIDPMVHRHPSLANRMFKLAVCVEQITPGGTLSFRSERGPLKDGGWFSDIGFNRQGNGHFPLCVPGGLILRTSLFWVSELMQKICPARTSPFIWVGILCQTQHG